MNGNNGRVAVAANDLSDWLIAHGQHFVTSDAVAKILGVPKDQATTMIARQKARGRIFSPTRGAYAPIPPEYRNWGTVPASHFVDALMQHLGHPYYVAFLTAAEIHDAAHQRPQAFSSPMCKCATGHSNESDLSSPETSTSPDVRSTS